MGQWSSGGFFSETCALKSWCRGIRDLKPGEIVIIDDKGIQYDSYTDDTQLAICSSWSISILLALILISTVSNVHTARKNEGLNYVNSSMRRISWSIGFKFFTQRGYRI